MRSFAPFFGLMVGVVLLLAVPVSRAYLFSFVLGLSRPLVVLSAELQAEESAQSDEIAEQLSREARMAHVETENQRLREELEFVAAFRGETLSASVVGADPDSFSNALLIGAGASQGLAPGQPVMVNGWCIGKLANVENEWSRVMLWSDPQAAARIYLPRTEVSGIARGDLGGGLFLDLIPQGKPIEVGDTVVTSGLDPKIPAGLPFAVVDEVTSDATEIFQQARLRVPVTTERALLVTVLLT